MTWLWCVCTVCAADVYTHTVHESQHCKSIILPSSQSLHLHLYMYMYLTPIPSPSLPPLPSFCLPPPSSFLLLPPPSSSSLLLLLPCIPAVSGSGGYSGEVSRRWKCESAHCRLSLGAQSLLPGTCTRRGAGTRYQPYVYTIEEIHTPIYIFF